VPDNFTLLSTYFTLEGKTAFKHPVSCVLVSKEQSRRNKEESGHAVQEEEKQPKPDTEKCSLTGDSNKPTRGNSLVSAKKRKTVEMLEKKRKKKKIRMMQ